MRAVSGEACQNAEMSISHIISILLRLPDMMSIMERILSDRPSAICSFQYMVPHLPDEVRSENRKETEIVIP